LAPQKFRVGGHGSDQTKSYGPAIIDDDTGTPPHARFKSGRLALIAAIGSGLWAGTLALLVAGYGWNGTYTQMAWFFTKAALLTFGGAYAVLPYVYQGAVENFGWLTGTQMIDGLALGETTPGPLIMIVAFVGFVGGWSKAVLGPSALFWSGFMGGAIATFFTFLPSFLFILLGGPLVEATHGDLKFTAPLTAITAAVVGVIVNLAVFFAWHVLWPMATAAAPFAGRFEWPSALIGLAAFMALFRFKVGVIPVIVACGIAGLAYRVVA
jgi:chromate transporter